MINAVTEKVTKKASIKVNKKYKLGEWVQSYLMISPQLIGFFIFSLYPILWVLRLAFYDYDGVRMRFVFMDNFIKIFTMDINFWQSVLNTFLISFIRIIVGIPLSLVLAVILSSKIRGRNIFRISYFMPSVMSSAVMALIFYFLYSSYGGIVNILLQYMNIINEPINWFGEKWAAITVILTAFIWMGFGTNIIFFLAGLQNIPHELYECSEIDGANNFQQFFKVTLPMLAPITRTVVMLEIIGSLKAADLILVLTGGGPGGSTDVMMTYIFKQFFNWDSMASPRYGYASALGFVTAIIVAVITILYLNATKKSAEVNG